MSFFEELRRRNVFRVGIAYAMTAWVVLQIADLVLDNSEAPDWVMDVFLLVLSLGFVVSLVIAWAYEVTPEGIKRESEIDRDESITQHTGKKLNYITLAAVGILITFFVADRFSGDAAAPTNVAPVAAEAVVLTTPEARGIAVLPFTNLSEDPNNAYFAGGVHEDVLTHLSRIDDLRVISRTSMLKVAERGMDVREIGDYLGVSHVLEGSVRRAGNQVRVTVQLITTSNDEHIWAENFDHELTDIFAIQSEIAQKIAGQLQIEMSPEQVQQMAEAPTDNLRAYELYKKASEMGRVWLSAEGFLQQLPLLEEAVALDPNFVEAQAALVNVLGRLVWTGSDDDGSYRERARRLSDHITEKWPDSAEAGLARGDYFYTVERDYAQAVSVYLDILPSRPQDSELLLAISSSYKRLGRFELGKPYIERAISLDPQHPSILGEYGFHLLGQGRQREAMQHFENVIELIPEDLSARSSLAGYALRLEGDLDRYFEQLDLIAEAEPDSAFADGGSMTLELLRTDVDSILQRLDRLHDTATGVSRLRLDVQVAELLNIVGREEASVARARGASADIRALLSDENFPSNTLPNVAYATFAYAGCLANEQSAFDQYRSIVRALDAEEVAFDYIVSNVMALAHAECGDIDTAWELMKKSIAPNTILGFTEWEFVLDPLYAHYFSELDEFKAMVERKNSEKLQ